MDLATMLVKIDDVLYTWLLIYLLAGSGIYFSIRTRFVQIRRFKDALNCMMEKKEGDKGVSSFQALMIATASRVGTGNMAGVATAIIMGGPGAAFWMWLMAVLGSASAFIESTLAQIYKKKEGDTFKGGPAYYIERALHARWLGIIFAISLIATFAFGFNGLQAYNIVSAFDVYVEDLSASIVPTVIGVILELLAFTIGGIVASNMAKNSPDLNLTDFVGEESTKIYDDSGELVTEVGVYLRENIVYDKCPESIVDAFLSIEDSRFFSHFGFDIPRFTKALIDNIKAFADGAPKNVVN